MSQTVEADGEATTVSNSWLDLLFASHHSSVGNTRAQ